MGGCSYGIFFFFCGRKVLAGRRGALGLSACVVIEKNCYWDRSPKASVPESKNEFKKSERSHKKIAQWC